MHFHLVRNDAAQNGKREDGDKWVEPPQRPPPPHPHFAPLRLPIGIHQLSRHMDRY